MDSDTVQEIVAQLREPVMHAYGPDHGFIALPQGMTLQDIKQFLPPPNRIRQRATLLTVSAFIAYIKRYADDSSTVFADEPAAKYEVVLDYHNPEERGDQDHIAFYACPQSENWQIWNRSDDKWFTQTEFAEFLETNLRDITQPSGAHLLQVALQLQIHKSAEFSSEVNLENGQVRLRYEETLRSGNKKAGDLEIPAAFKITIPVFVDGVMYEIPARFRYQMEGGKLSLGYKLIRPKDVLNAAVKVVTAEIREGIEPVHLYAGRRA